MKQLIKKLSIALNILLLSVTTNTFAAPPVKIIDQTGQDALFFGPEGERGSGKKIGAGILFHGERLFIEVSGRVYVIDVKKVKHVNVLSLRSSEDERMYYTPWFEDAFGNIIDAKQIKTSALEMHKN